jgi:hypothetical protein
MTKTIKLQKPVTWFDKPLSEISLKEPSALDFISIGEPQTLVRHADDSAYFIENDIAIGKYFERLLNVDGGISVLAVLSVTDGIALKRALFSFFTDGAREIST